MGLFSRKTSPTRLSLSDRFVGRLAVKYHDLKARYDAAQTTDGNRRHWANADDLGPQSALTAATRKTIRTRARYEAANNSYAKGIVLTLANDVIGAGPRLQLLSNDPAANQAGEKAFTAWSRAVDLPAKLRTMRMAKVIDGEVFAMLTTNDALAHPVTLDVRPIETDRIAGEAMLSYAADNTDDGITFDAAGNPTTYRVLNRHPGDAAAEKASDVLADKILHLYRADRPGQTRGISELTPALGLFAQLRRYTAAVLDAAELAADFAGVLQTDAPADATAAAIDAMDTIELESRMITTLPEGWKLGQVKAEQPTTTYKEFKAEILNEIARCLNMPFNVAAGNSAGYNYASGRLDHQVYYKAIRIEQAATEAIVLDRILTAWLNEASRTIPALAPLASSSPVLHQWFWEGTEHVDPAKEANAQATRLTNNTTNLAAEYARQGKDWETELRQIAIEIALQKKLGIPLANAPAPAAAGADAPDDDDEKDSDQ